MNHVYAEDLTPGMLVHDEEGPITFVVDTVNVREHSVMVTGNQIVAPPFGSPAKLHTIPYTTMYIKGDKGLYNLSA